MARGDEAREGRGAERRDEGVSRVEGERKREMHMMLWLYEGR